MPVHTITSIETLNIQPESVDENSPFSFKTTTEYARKMDLNDPNDPLLKQVLPTIQERFGNNETSKDPLKESLFNNDAGIIKKYNGRALLIVTGHCDIHCRYCFRRHYPYEQNHLGPNQIQKAIDFIRANPDIEELILSGGDPLSLSNHHLKKTLSAFSNLPQLKRLRIHTRTPVARHARLDEGLLKCLQETPWRTSLVLHINHANELDNVLKQSLLPFMQSGISLLNQSVLLKGINDDVEVLVALSEALYDAHVLPYYLHVLDAVEGSQPFNMSLEHAKTLHSQLKHRLSGYLVPKLVQERPGEASKTWL